MGVTKTHDGQSPPGEIDGNVGDRRKDLGTRCRGVGNPSAQHAGRRVIVDRVRTNGRSETTH